MSTFMESMTKATEDFSNVSITENGAKGYKTTGEKILDLNFKIPSLRKKVVKGHREEAGILEAMFKEALEENPDVAVKWLFYARDIRGGLGEREIFRVLFKYLVTTKPNEARHLIQQVPEYGRWDDILYLLEIPTSMKGTISENLIIGDNKKHVMSIIHNQLVEDVKNMNEGKPISLLAKWLPSITGSSYESKTNAKRIARGLGLSHKSYRVLLSSLRSYLKIVEKQMSDNKWDDIDYSRVPSKAALLYNKAFLRHDNERFKQYLESLKNGETKINVSTLYPHEIVYKYEELGWTVPSEDPQAQVLEEMWKSLPDKFGDKEPKIMVVRDGSGSMKNRKLAGSNCRAMHVGTALAIYFAERLTGEFHNKFITFSMFPTMVNLDRCETLFDKIQETRKHTEMENTNIENVFSLILNVAIEQKMSQEDMPESILILSDMEFDSSVEASVERSYYTKLFEVFKKNYEDAGYKLPRIIFWNIGSDTDTIPMKQNELGVTLVSGYSLNTLQAVLSDKADPFEVLLDILNSKRYETIFLDHSGPEENKDYIDFDPEIRKAKNYSKAVTELMKGIH